MKTTRAAYAVVSEAVCPVCNVKAVVHEGEYVCPNCGYVLGPVVYLAVAAEPTFRQTLRLREEAARRMSEIPRPKTSVTDLIVRELSRLRPAVRDRAIEIMEELKRNKKVWIKVVTKRPKTAAAALAYVAYIDLGYSKRLAGLCVKRLIKKTRNVSNLVKLILSARSR